MSVSSKPGDTITLTYSAKSSNNNNNSSSNNNSSYPHKNISTIPPKLASELKSISEAMKQQNGASLESRPPGSPTESMVVGEGEERRVAPRKKRRKPAAGNEEERRPMNGFMLFAKKMRVELTKLYPGKDNR